MRLSTNPLISFPNKNLDSLKENCARSPALCLSNPILLVVATFERVQGEKSGLAKALRSVECGVCLRGEKICHFGAVVYSNVRERTNEKLLRSTLPASFPPPLLFHPHTHYWARPASCHIWRRFLNTRNFKFCAYSANKHAFANYLSVRVNLGFSW